MNNEYFYTELFDISHLVFPTSNGGQKDAKAHEGFHSGYFSPRRKASEKGGIVRERWQNVLA